MSYFDILNTDVICDILIKLEFRYVKILIKNYVSIKNVCNNELKWRYILSQEYPEYANLVSRLKCHPQDYEIVYHYYKDNFNGFKTLINSRGIKGSKQEGIAYICYLPKIIRKMWLNFIYPFSYDNLVSIAGDDKIDYGQYEKRIIHISESWNDLLNSISYVEFLCDRYPTFEAVISYLSIGGSVPSDLIIENIFNKSMGSDNLFVVIWLLSIDSNIVVPGNYVPHTLRIGIKLHHFDGIKIFLSKLSNQQLNDVCSIYKAPILFGNNRVELLMKYITTNIDRLSKQK